jgi:hypothetical protein
MASDEIKAACVKCQYSHLVDMPPPNIGKQRLCKLMPPTISFFAVSQRGQSGVTSLTAFPVVADEWWCFQFAPLPAEKN